ncbi:MAG: hypothetical protein GDA41_11170 [Rhodospirillales bacterium]|nr:hypothetical protein [Rhodospirillales bacterium]
MKALKTLVIVMGVLIVAGFAFVAITVIDRMSGGGSVQLLGNLALSVEADCTLADAWSARGLLYLRIAGDSRCMAIVMIDPKTRKEVGRVTLGGPKAAVE